MSISISLLVCRRNAGAGKFLDQPQGQIERCRHRSAANNAVLLGQYFGNPQIDFGVAPGKNLGLGPVRCRNAAVEQARFGEDETAGAVGGKQGAALVLATQRGEQRLQDIRPFKKPLDVGDEGAGHDHTASAVVLALIGPSTFTICPDAVCTGLPSSDSMRHSNSGAVPRLWPFLSAQTALAAVKTSIDPATPEARMPSYTHILMCRTACPILPWVG